MFVAQGNETPKQDPREYVLKLLLPAGKNINNLLLIFVSVKLVYPGNILSSAF